MAEIEKNRNPDPGLDLDAPTEDLETEKPEDEKYLTVYDEKGNPRQLKVIFTVQDKANNAAYIYVEQGEDEVLCLATKIDADGKPLQDELEVVGDNSPYLASALEFLKAYNEGNLSHETDDEAVAKILESKKK